MHCLKLSLAIAGKFSCELQILGLEELRMVQQASIYLLALDHDIILVDMEFEEMH